MGGGTAKSFIGESGWGPARALMATDGVRLIHHRALLNWKFVLPPLFETITESERVCIRRMASTCCSFHEPRKWNSHESGGARAGIEKSEARADTGEQQFSKLSREESSYTVERQSIRQAIFHTWQRPWKSTPDLILSHTLKLVLSNIQGSGANLENWVTYKPIKKHVPLLRYFITLKTKTKEGIKKN